MSVKYIPEPFKIKMVEPIRMTTREEREQILAEAHYNAFSLPADGVYIDLQTDSGTGAMSDAQWAGVMRGDEAYSGGRSYYRLMEVAKDVFGYDYTQPVHQGRAAEKVLMPIIAGPGKIVISNTFFDTTRAHVGLTGARPIDNICDEGLDTALRAPFKGNMNVEKLEELIREHGPENIGGIVMTITNNSAGGQPVSIENMKATSAIAKKYGLLMIIDAARYAENAWFIKEREEGYADKTPTEITREFFSYADAFTMSAKKDAILNMGGMLAVRDAEEQAELVTKIKSSVISYEGYLTYGGLAGRDLEAFATGLLEGLSPDYLAYRIGQVEYLGGLLDDLGVPYQSPAGGHGIFVDAGKLLPHIPWHQYPGHALAMQLYLEAGIRSCDIGSFLMDRDPITGEQQQAPFEFTRLAIPRRVYTQSHLDLIAEALGEIKKHPEAVPGYEITWEPPVLRHFTSHLRPIQAS